MLRVSTRPLVRHVGTYDPSSVGTSARQTLHLYFTEGPRGMRGGHWTYSIAAVLDGGVANPPSGVGDTRFVGYARDGRVLFDRRTSYATDASPGLTYMADVSTAPDIERRLGRIDVVYRGKTYSRRALPYAPPSARARAVDASHILIDLDCEHYSSVMVHYAENRELTPASTDALETVRNCWVSAGSTSLRTPIETRNDVVYLDFNNGLLYTDLGVRIQVDGRSRPESSLPSRE